MITACYHLGQSGKLSIDESRLMNDLNTLNM
jgi:hypothetical protein